MMASRAEIAFGSREHDAGALEEAAKIMRRRVKKPAGISAALFCRTLTTEASNLRKEAHTIRCEWFDQQNALDDETQL